MSLSQQLPNCALLGCASSWRPHEYGFRSCPLQAKQFYFNLLCTGLLHEMVFEERILLSEVFENHWLVILKRKSGQKGKGIQTHLFPREILQTFCLQKQSSISSDSQRAIQRHRTLGVQLPKDRLKGIEKRAGSDSLLQQFLFLFLFFFSMLLLFITSHSPW